MPEKEIYVAKGTRRPKPTKTDVAVQILREHGPITPGDFGRLLWPGIHTTNKRGQPMRPMYAGAFLGRLRGKGLATDSHDDEGQSFWAAADDFHRLP